MHLKDEIFFNLKHIKIVTSLQHEGDFNDLLNRYLIPLNGIFCQIEVLEIEIDSYPRQKSNNLLNYLCNLPKSVRILRMILPSQYLTDKIKHVEDSRLVKKLCMKMEQDETIKLETIVFENLRLCKEAEN